jgi:hypothetical protein
LREANFPSKSLREKEGATLLTSNLWTPKASQEGRSAGTDGLEETPLRIRIRTKATARIVKRRKNLDLIFVLESHQSFL